MTESFDQISAREQWVDKHPKVIKAKEMRDKHTSDTRELENSITQGLDKIKSLMVGVDVLQDKVWDLEGNFPKKQEKFLRKATNSDSESWFWTHTSNVNSLKELAVAKCEEVFEAKKSLEKLESNPPWKKFWEMRQAAEEEYNKTQLKDDYSKDIEDLCDETGRPL